MVKLYESATDKPDPKVEAQAEAIRQEERLR
jgi:hypothetical protein